MLYSMTKKMIANIYLSLDFPKQNSIFANSSKKGVKTLKFKENNFSDYLLTFPLENTEKTNDLSSLFSP